MTPIEVLREQFVVQRQGSEIVVSIESEQFSVVIERGVSVFNITQNAESATVVASESLGGHRAVTIDGYYADATNIAHAYKVMGITTGAVTIGATATIKTFGEITESGWNWTIGEPVFLSTNGNLTQTPPVSPSLCVIMGKPKNATTLIVDISETVFLG